MTFAWPHLLWLLAAPAALLAWELTAKRRQASAAHPHILRAEAGMRSLTLAETSFVPSPAARAVARRRWWLCAGAALGIVALARPQWGRIDEPMFNQSREIVIAIDLSRSMLSQDVTPSRLERAKLLVESLLDRLAGERVGLLVFSGTAFLQSPLSADYEILREFLPALGPDYLPVGGTNYGAMIDAAAEAFEGQAAADRFLIVLSDGGANDPDWRDHIGKLKAKGIRVIGLGVGTAAGGFIPDVGGGFMKDEQGAVVLAKLESDNLHELANRTGGAYRDAGEWVDLAALLKATVEAGRRGKFVEKNTVRYVERYQWALAPALLCLLMSLWREFPVRPRPRDVLLKSALTAAPILLALCAAASLASPAARGESGGAAPPPESSALLGRIVGRLSAQSTPSALDWAELARQTVTWGQELQSAHQPVLPGPVHDALAAVDTGSALNARATDWPRLRADLEALLKQPQDQKKPDPPQQKQQQKQQQDQQQNQQQNQQSSQQPGNPQPQKQPSSAQPGQSGQSNPQQQSEAKPGSPKTGDDAFGGLKSQPPPSHEEMQRIGGATERKSRDPARADPALAIPLQKLEQARNADSPAELYQMIENKEPKPIPADNTKNW